MSDLLRIKRGLKVDLPELMQGEYGFTTDTEQIYIGGVNGNVLVNYDSVINVKLAPYKAKGDGVNDDTTAIQSAINQAKANGGGIVYFPNGTYCYTALTIDESNIVFLGESFASILKQTTLTGNGVTVYNNTKTLYNVVFKNMAFDGTGKTADSTIDFLDIHDCLVSECKFINQWSGVQFNVFGNCRLEKCLFENIKGYGIFVYNGDDLYISQTNMSNDTINSGSIGIKWQASGGLFVSNVDLIKFDYGVYINPAAGENASWGFFNTLLCDTGNYGIIMNGSLGQIRNIHSNNSWYSSNAQVGIQLSYCDGFSSTGDTILQNHSHGLFIDANSKNVNVNGSYFVSNNTDNGVNGSGIFVDANASSFMIKNCFFLNEFTGLTVFNQKYGIFISSGASDRYSIENNYFKANMVSPISDQSTGTNRRIKSNISDETTSIASSATITIPITGDFFTVTGSTNIANAGGSWIGRKITLMFTGTLSVSSGFNFMLSGGTLAATPNTILELVWDGAHWQEISRSTNS